MQFSPRHFFPVENLIFEVVRDIGANKDSSSSAQKSCGD